MSVTFYISGESPNYEADACPACIKGEWQTCEACNGTGFSEAYRAGKATPQNYVNLANIHAIEVLRWLGFEVDPQDLSGVLTPADLRARCTRRMRPTPDNVASDLPRASFTRGRMIQCGRASGYLASRAADLLALAERAGDRLISFD